MILEIALCRKIGRAPGHGYSERAQHLQCGAEAVEQYWVDNTGGNIFFYGGLKDGAMIIDR